MMLLKNNGVTKENMIDVNILVSKTQKGSKNKILEKQNEDVDKKYSVLVT